jgi:hypothetical protein
VDDARRHYQKRLVTGMIVLTIGVLFTLDHLGIVQAGDLLRWWPVLLIVYGLWRVSGFGLRRSWLWGGVCILAGVWQLLYDGGVVAERVWDLWPVLLIVWGIAMMRGRAGAVRIGVVRIDRAERRRLREEMRARYAGAAAAAMPPDPVATGDDAGGAGAPASPRAMLNDRANHFSLDAVLSSIARRVTSQSLQGGAVTAVMGSAELDLRQAAMADGVARLETHIVMGGANITVPTDWQVEFHGSSIMSSVDDFTARVATPRGRLVVTGVVLMGQIVLRN